MQESAKVDMTISIIIPVFNEEKKIVRLIDHLRKIQNDRSLELIVVDGNKKGSTIKWLQDRNVITLSSKKGRALQMNRGADKATGDILLFLHADTFLPNHAFEKIRGVCRHNKYVGGSFDLGFDNQKWVFALIAAFASLRSRISRIPFGDQAIFVKSKYFEKIDGFNKIPLMEDVEFMKRIKKRGDKIYIIPLKVTTSARKWEKEGIIQTTLRNWLLQFFYFCGISPEKLVRYYYKRGDP